MGLLAGVRQRWNGKAEGAPVTAWQQADGTWQRYRRDPDVRAMWWKGVAVLAMCGTMVQGVSIVSIAKRATVEPYYVFVTQKGEVLGTERVGGKPFNPGEQVLQFLTQEWVQWVRSIPLDGEVLKANWEKAMHMSTQPVAARLFKYAKEIDLTALAKKAAEKELAVKVVMINVRAMSERSVRVQWQETIYDGANVARETAQYTGDFEFIVRKPETQAEFDANPLGIWMARFTWSKDLV